MTSSAVPISISLSCLFIIGIVCIVFYIYNTSMKRETTRIMADIVNQVNNSNLHAYKFDKKQEENILNVGNNVGVIDKRLKANENIIEDVKKNSLTKESLTKGVPFAKFDSLNVQQTIEFPNNGTALVWGGGTSKISDNGDLLIQTDKRTIITSPESVKFNTRNLSMNGNPVALSDYEIFTNATDSLGRGGQWVIDDKSKDWDPEFRGGRLGLAYSVPENDQDAENIWIDYTVPKGMKQAYVVHQPWSNCRYFDVYGKKGQSYIFVKRVDAYNPNTTNIEGRHEGTTAVGVAGVNRFDTLRIKGRKGRIHLMGVGWTREEGRAMESGYMNWDNIYNKPNLMETNKWLTSLDGKPRVYYAANGRSYSGSSDGYEWRDRKDGKIMEVTNTGDLNVIGNINTNGNANIKGQLDSSSLVTSGNAIINGELKTNKLTAMGNTLIKGQLDTGTINATGNVAISGQLDANTLNTLGNATIRGNISTSSINASGNTTIKGQLDANTLNTLGDATIKGNISTSSINASGNTTIKGQLDANTLNTLGNATFRGHASLNTFNADGVANFKNSLTAERNITAKGNVNIEGLLCLGEVCVTKEQLKKMVTTAPALVQSPTPTPSIELAAQSSVSQTDCKVSDWSIWSNCSKTCGGGTRNRTRTITQQSTNGGQSCPTLTETQPCSTQACPVDCQVSDW